MIEQAGDLWEIGRYADAVVITTNGYVKANGNLVMGAGTAGQAQDKMPWLPKRLGALVKEHGNHVHMTMTSLEQGVQFPLVTFPVKHVWYENAEYPLIWRSCRELVELADKQGWKKVVLPRPGCGNGKLSWIDVRPILEQTLDDRFVVVEK